MPIPKIEENIPFRDYCTFRIGGLMRYFATVSKAELIPFLAEKAQALGIPIHILGAGSNTVGIDEPINRFVIKMEEQGIEPIDETKETISFRVNAGTAWDDFVAETVLRNISGIEALSAIPGTVGAAPVQNIGAYGQEVKNTIQELQVFNLQQKRFMNLTAEDCRFGYRQSLFNTTARNQFAITSVVFKLSKQQPAIPKYPDLQKYFAENPKITISPQTIREAIIGIRARKLPDLKLIPNAGSFFKTPTVPAAIYEKISKDFPTIPATKTLDNQWKIAGGWLIEQCGFKGQWLGNVGVSEKNALVLVSNGKAKFSELTTLRNTIIQAVQDRFHIQLEIEPEILS